MVRETRHLWVGNLPDNIREDRIREHFKRYGRVQNVKLLGRTENTSSSASTVVGGNPSSGFCATVAFMDIKSASKAHNAEHILDERTLTTEYYEPVAIPSSTGAPSAGSSPAGSGYSGSSSSVNSVPAPASTSRYHLSGGEETTGNTCAIAAAAAAPAWRGTNDSASDYCRRGSTPSAYGRYQRNNSTAPYSTPPSNVERTTPHHRWYGSGERTGGATGGESTPSTPGATEGRRRRRSGSGSSRSESSSPEPSDTSRASTPAAPPRPGGDAALLANHRVAPQHQHQWASTASGRPLAICVRNLPTRSTDSSLKDGLYHEYKKHGKVVWVKVVGQNADRYAVVRFKKPSDVEKALEVSQDKLFFGCKISVAPHQSCDEDADSAKPYETDIDEYHPKATRTLFIGNLEKDVTQQQLRDKFKHFGRIIEIDIKKGSSGGAGYAFCQYASIPSVVEAIRAMDGEYVGGSRVKLGFGKPVATTCVWLDGLTEHTEKQVLGAVSRCGAAKTVCVDRAAGAALVHFDQAAAAGAALRELRRVAAQVSAAEPDHPRLCVDYASRECQEAFYEQLEKHGGSAALTGSERLSGDLSTRYVPSTRHDPLRYDACGSRSRAPSYGRGSSRTPRYSTLDHYDPADYAADRRYRVYDELGSSPQAEDTPYEERLQSVVVSPHRARRHRRDSSPEDRKQSKERHRSASGSVRRSRSGSRGGERHAGRRRHRRRRDGSGSRGSRAGTPLRDEVDAPPTEPRRPPRERPPLPMSLPLPKFAAQLLRTAPPTPRPAPAPAPASPSRPPSASSSSTGSAPHSPSLEERIRSLDEKYEKWSGLRTLADAPDRARLRHRLLDVDINEVKPSEVVRSLLAKRSVFDEDSERLEGAVRAPSPTGSPRARPSSSAPRTLRYPFPAHPPQLSHSTYVHQPHPPLPDGESETSDRLVDPRLNRPERIYQLERLGKFNDSEYRLESRVRLRTPSTDKSQPDSYEHKPSPNADRLDIDREIKKDIERKRRDSTYSSREGDTKPDLEVKESKQNLERNDVDNQKREYLDNTESRHFSEGNDHSIDKLSLSLVANKADSVFDEQVSKRVDSLVASEIDENNSRDILLRYTGQNQECSKAESKVDKTFKLNNEASIKCEYNNKMDVLSQDAITGMESESKINQLNYQLKLENDKRNDISIQNHIKQELLEFEMQQNHLNAINSLKPGKEMCELNHEFIKASEKNGKERYNQNMLLEVIHNTKQEKENIEFDKSSEKDKVTIHTHFTSEKKLMELDKTHEDRRNDRDKSRHYKERLDKDKHDNEKDKKHNKADKTIEKFEKDKRIKEEYSDEKPFAEKMEKLKTEREVNKDKTDRDPERSRNNEEKHLRHDHHNKKDKLEKEKRKEEVDACKLKKEEKYKSERSKKDDSKRENKKDSDKVRKSSRDETCRDMCRKDSTDSSTSRNSYESCKLKDLDGNDLKEESRQRAKTSIECVNKQKTEKELSPKPTDCEKIETKIKSEIKEEKIHTDIYVKVKSDNNVTEHSVKSRTDFIEKQRHNSLDSPNLESKRKERLNSSSSLPSNIGHKRRISSQDGLDSLSDDIKKSRNDLKLPERRDSKDSRNADRQKTTKFSKGHFAKIIESKTKEDKKNQVKPPDDAFEWKDGSSDKTKTKRSPKEENDEKLNLNNALHPEGLQNDLDFLATLELRSSEEDERQKALRKELKEKKRIQQLQQIQELQMQQDALQQTELMNKVKEEKKTKSDEKKKEIAREKRMSTDRKSRDEKNDSGKRKNRKPVPSTDSSDSDEPKKHSIFDIIDDEPTYISMYDKVKARSCKNMQKQEEEKRQEKIKAKFSQLKQSRAKREEKKRSSWDEDSDSDHDRRKHQQKVTVDSSDEDEQMVLHNKKREKSHSCNIEYDRNKMDYFNSTSAEEDSRNKLSRKNSRTRIISDTSDEEKSQIFANEIKKETMSDSESLQTSKYSDSSVKDSSGDKIKKNSLLNLFGKSDSDDNKLKCNIDSSNDYKPNFIKSNSNDFSSESESLTSNRLLEELRKKHKKKQRKHKFSFSDEESKIENIDVIECDIKNKHDKARRHNNRKEKRKDKNRESFDVDDVNDKIKSKKNKRFLTNCCDISSDTSPNNIKKDGKMEDIFGPISDDSDRETTELQSKQDLLTDNYNPPFCISNDQLNVLNHDETKLREKEDTKRKRDRKRKEKRYFIKDDENSLDVDAVSKAIEARLFEDSVNEDEIRTKADLVQEMVVKPEENENNTNGDKNNEKLKKDMKEKKKKKKKSREDRQNRKDYHHYHLHDRLEKSEHIATDNLVDEMSSKTLLSEIPLPNDNMQVTTLQPEDNKLLSESSLPRLTDSPPIDIHVYDDNETNNNRSRTPHHLSVENNMEMKSADKKEIEVREIPMPPLEDNIVQDISEVPLPEDPSPVVVENKIESFKPNFSAHVDNSENAVRSISNLDKDVEKQDKIDTQLNDVEEKMDGKARAIISQEETEDAVAALLGESFGGKVRTFANCYEEVETDPSERIEMETSVIGNENIPEEDAEEMRRAVQNLNASVMEIKPDTPVSDNDLLLIDTDTEEADEIPQDSTEKLPINIIATSQSINTKSEQSKKNEITNIIVSKHKPNLIQTHNKETNEPEDFKNSLDKRENTQQITSTATPVITSWTLTNNKKLLEPHVLNIQATQLPNRDKSDNKPTHITANIVQIKTPSNQINNTARPIIAHNRINAPYQVINQMIRPQVSNMQPPTIKIPPESHILYQKPQSIVISPRMPNDPRLQSPKISPQGEGMSSPRVTNMTILSTSPPNLNAVGMTSSNLQRSPGQVTVVRMQQPPLSPIQAMHIPHGTRAMVSPNRPNSVLVQTQGAPIHFNRLPVTPVLAPISKQMGSNSMVTQNKGLGANNSTPIHQQKIITNDSRKGDQRISENEDSPKITLSPTSLQSSTNPTVMAQNRLISMQNAVHMGSISSTLHLSNKVLLNNMSQINDKRENQVHKSEHHNHIPFGTAPIIHVTGINHSATSIIQSGTKPVMCTIQEGNTINRGPSNVIHTINSQRLLTTAPITNVIQLDANKTSPSVLSMATIRTPTVLTKLESSNSVAVTTTSLTNVVMTPLLLRASSPSGSIRLTSKSDIDYLDNSTIQNHSIRDSDEKRDDKNKSTKATVVCDSGEKPKEISRSVKSEPPTAENHTLTTLTKCETDFEELLKDNTNEIKVKNDPEKKLEVNVGNTVTLITTNDQRHEREKSVNALKTEFKESDIPVSEESIANVTVTSNVDERKVASNVDERKVFDNNLSSKIKDEVTDSSLHEDINTPKKDVELKKVEMDTYSDISLDKACSKNSNEPNSLQLREKINTSEHSQFSNFFSNQIESNDNQIKYIEENDCWSAKDVNIESVIKKVDSLCNDNTDLVVKKDNENNTNPNKDNDNETETIQEEVNPLDNSLSDLESKNSEISTENIFDSNPAEEFNTEKIITLNKRGGRNVRGKKSEKIQDRIQTRQISKPRGAASAKRGRGRTKIEKKIKDAFKSSVNNIPGDVYDFHEDSGDESTSPNKTEARPRLILTIKSPLSGNSNVVATSTLSITSKDHVKVSDKIKEEKTEDFVSPSPNTRKSRRLQEKDVQRSTVDDVIDDVIKNNSVQTRASKETKKRPTRQIGIKTILQDKTSSDTRKSPRGVKRTRDMSLSDASIDSNDEKLIKKEEIPKEPKQSKMAEPTPVAKTDPETSLPVKPAVAVQPVVNNHPPAPTPIMKPPKKMISEISAKLASVFEAAASAAPVRCAISPNVHERIVEQADKTPLESDKQAPLLREFRNPELATAAPTASELMAVVTGEALGGEVYGRRLVDNLPSTLMPVGATEATDARVQSPALPHRPPSMHRPADRTTPVLVRVSEGETSGGAMSALGAMGATGAGVLGVASVAGVTRPLRAAYAGAGASAGAGAAAASLPRGAHHPPPPPHAKQVAVVGPHQHHQHPGAASRVTITSVPTISPQGQMALGEGMYPHFSHQHYQMYQQHFRATQHENRATPPYTRCLEAEGSEAPTPPLELRRPPSARVPRPAHSPSPADRLIMYAVGCGRSPPPAHGTSRLPAALPPPGPAGPPHASQVPREADSLQMLLRRYPVMWQGLLALKNDSAAVQMHFVGGNPAVAGDTLPRHTDGSTPPLRIAQRMRLEPAQLDQVHRKMKLENEHCMLLALPCGRDHMDVLQQSTNLTAGFITYLQRKQAAGIVNVAPPGHHQAMYTVHIFPSCDFANENLNRIAPDLMHRVADIAHLLIVIATV